MHVFHPNSSSTRFSGPARRKLLGAKVLLIGAGLLAIINVDTSFATPADEARVVGVISAVAIYADNRDFKPLERFFAPQTTIDYTSLWGGAPQNFAPEALMNIWGNLLPGFDATRHELSDIRVQTNTDTATATANVRATHWLGDRTWTVAGSYDYALIRSQTGWQVSRMVFRLTEETGNRSLVEEAAAKVAAGKK